MQQDEVVSSSEDLLKLEGEDSDRLGSLKDALDASEAMNPSRVSTELQSVCHTHTCV